MTAPSSLAVVSMRPALSQETDAFVEVGAECEHWMHDFMLRPDVFFCMFHGKVVQGHAVDVMVHAGGRQVLVEAKL